jgi:HEAT repeat protein
MGKHLAADKRTIPAEKRAALKTLDGLNKTLFEPYPELREAAIVALGARADNSSIPYLALALQDPDQKVSYGAYRLLVRLTGAGKPAAGEAEYAASTDMVKAPLYAWWADELNGKHLPPPQHTELR